MKNFFVLIIVFSVLINKLYSQNKTINGRIISNQLYESLIGVQIMINDTIKVGVTDIDGFFQIDIPISENKITFDYIGSDRATIWLEGKCNIIEVVMMLSSSYCFHTSKQAEKDRKRNYKKLSSIYRQAYKKGIFESENACYIRKFEPFFLK